MPNDCDAHPAKPRISKQARDIVIVSATQFLAVEFMFLHSLLLRLNGFGSCGTTVSLADTVSSLVCSIYTGSGGNSSVLDLYSHIWNGKAASVRQSIEK